MYDVRSKNPEEFINHEEILETLSYAEANKHNVELIDQIIAKAKERKGSPTGKLPFFLTVISKRKMKKFMHLQNRSKKISTETVSSCLRRSICPTTVSTDVLTVRTI